MSNKNKNKTNDNNVATPEVEVVNEVTTEENTSEVKVEETPVVEEAEETEKEVKEETQPVEEVKVEEPIIKTPVVEEAEETSDTEADPLPEFDGRFYVSLGIEFREDKIRVMEERMAKTGFKYITTATGEAVVGPFVTEEEAIKAKKVIIGKGLKGTVRTF